MVEREQEAARQNPVAQGPVIQLEFHATGGGDHIDRLDRACGIIPMPEDMDACK
jgi:hypothetical protein